MMRIVFAGTPLFACSSLTALLEAGHEIVGVYTQPDRLAGRGQKKTMSPVKALALQQGFSVFQPIRFDDAAQQQLSDLSPELLIVVAYGLILPKAVLTIPCLGCVNVHASLLPRWRGASPIASAILAGDTTTGISIMQMDEGLDTGDLLYQIDCSIHQTETSGILHDRLALLGAEALITTLNQWETLVPVKQPEIGACYAKKLSKTQARLDWKQSAEQLFNMVRAYNPWPMASTTINNQVIRIWKAHVITATQQALPGVIIAITKSGIDVACGVGYLRLVLIQLPGGKPLPVADLLNAPRDWMILGNRLE